MNEPKPSENVIAFKTEAGRVTVHAWRNGKWQLDKPGLEPITDCKRRTNFGRSRAWLWLQFRTLNPERVKLCQRCWEAD